MTTHPSSMSPNRRKAFGGPGGDDAVGGGAQKGKLKFKCIGPMHCQSVQQLCWRQVFPGLRLSGSQERHSGIHYGQVKRPSPRGWLLWLCSPHTSEKWDWYLSLSLLSLSDSQDLLGQYADLCLWICLILCSDLTCCLPNFLSFVFERTFMTMYWPIWDFHCS